MTYVTFQQVHHAYVMSVPLMTHGGWRGLTFLVCHTHFCRFDILMTHSEQDNTFVGGERE